MKNYKIMPLVLLSLFFSALTYSGEECGARLNLADEIQEKTNASTILEVSSILLGSRMNEDSSRDMADEINLPQNVNNSSRLSEI